MAGRRVRGHWPPPNGWSRGGLRAPYPNPYPLAPRFRGYGWTPGDGLHAQNETPSVAQTNLDPGRPAPHRGVADGMGDHPIGWLAQQPARTPTHPCLFGSPQKPAQGQASVSRWRNDHEVWISGRFDAEYPAADRFRPRSGQTEGVIGHIVVVTARCWMAGRQARRNPVTADGECLGPQSSCTRKGKSRSLRNSALLHGHMLPRRAAVRPCRAFVAPSKRHPGRASRCDSSTAYSVPRAYRQSPKGGPKWSSRTHTATGW
jgi:hypothetical protein